MYILFKKEISTFLSSLLGYIVIAVFLLITSLFIWVFPMEFNVIDYGFATIDGLFILAPFVFLFLIPAVTMRMFSEEKRTGTMELLLTKPVTDWQLVFSKFFAGVVLVILALLPTLVYVFSIGRLGAEINNFDMGGTIGSYIGLLLLGIVFVSIGLFASSLTDNPIVSFLIAMFLSGFLYIGFDFIHNLSLFGQFDLFIKMLGLNAHYISISRGVVDTRDIVYFLSVIILFLLLTRLSIQRRNW